MQIIVDITEGDDGRPVGTIRAAGRPGARPFAGNLEFLALVEDHYRADTGPAGAASGLDIKEES